jgi:hypothetical protein
VGTWHDVQERWSHCDDKRSAFNDLGLVVVMAFAYRGVVWEQPLLASVVGDCVTGCCGRGVLFRVYVVDVRFSGFVFCVNHMYISIHANFVCE